MNPSPSPTRFRSAHGLATAVKILLIIGAILAGLTLVTESLSLPFPPPGEDQELADNPIGAGVLLIGFLVALGSVITYLVTVVFFAMWLYRTHSNLRGINAWSRLDHSPGWAVGSFFIPFVNLVVPYRAVKEVWQKSTPADEALLAEPTPPAIFPVWWTFWILASIAGNISARLSFTERVSQSTAAIVSIVASALFIAASMFAYLVVSAIDKRQEEARVRVGIEPFPGPPPPLPPPATRYTGAPVPDPYNPQQS